MKIEKLREHYKIKDVKFRWIPIIFRTWTEDKELNWEETDTERWTRERNKESKRERERDTKRERERQIEMERVEGSYHRDMNWQATNIDGVSSLQWCIKRLSNLFMHGYEKYMIYIRFGQKRYNISE